MPHRPASGQQRVMPRAGLLADGSRPGAFVHRVGGCLDQRLDEADGKRSVPAAGQQKGHRHRHGEVHEAVGHCLENLQ